MPLLLTIGLAISLVTVALLLLTRRRSSAVPPPAPPGSRAPVADPAPHRPRSAVPAPGTGAAVVDSGRSGSGEPAPGPGAGLVADSGGSDFGVTASLVVDSGRSGSEEAASGVAAEPVVDPGPFGSRGWIMLDAERSALAWEPLAAVTAGPGPSPGRRRP
ncbi:hypothetical protein Aca07nite_70160 [Actinoplanes capillaceus]|uniref:Uncharacterized protein n=1 Tax=Actinoplanes campanulatus TaxID=113559 RepID=A0ABQ3WTY1_9ACTN|nr:hypothetical protein [Actinoplanes capillaceus]GID49741.1 hypothetical protein Aca07nite_70160 [Actinoplanes capillaceus]